VGQSNEGGEEFHVPMKSENYTNISLLQYLIQSHYKITWRKHGKVPWLDPKTEHKFDQNYLQVNVQIPLCLMYVLVIYCCFNKCTGY